MFKPRFTKRSLVQPFKLRLINTTLGYIEKKKKKSLNGSIAAFLKTRLKPYPTNRSLNITKHGFKAGL